MFLIEQKKTVTKILSQFLFRNKWCSKACIYDIKTNLCKNVKSHFHKIFLYNFTNETVLISFLVFGIIRLVFLQIALLLILSSVHVG